MATATNLEKKITLPEGVTAVVTPTQVTIKGEKGEVTKKITTKIIAITLKDNIITLTPKKKQTKREKAMINTFVSHFKNMIQGVQEVFTYKLKICSSHFPMSVKLNGKILEVTNFIGEKIPRKLTIKEGAELVVEGDYITVTSADKALAGQVAADIEKLTKRTRFDKRVFMDGIFITEKAGAAIE